MAAKLIADSGSTKTEWCLLQGEKKTLLTTQGLSPYFLTSGEIQQTLETELVPGLKNVVASEIYFYGTGCSNASNVKIVIQALKAVFKDAEISVDHDLAGAAKALCGVERGIACILGTGSNSCYFDGKEIVKNNPGIGYVLGDEGAGTYLGRKVIQYFLYNTFDEELMTRFNEKYNTDAATILDAVYKKALPNRYLAGYANFLAENRGHYMVENIIEDSFNDFFFNHICKYSESWTLPIHFVGSVAYGFKDVLKEMCGSYELQLGQVLKTPMEGLIKYHQ